MRKPLLPGGSLSAMILREHMKAEAEPAPIRIRLIWAKMNRSDEAIRVEPPRHRMIEPIMVRRTPMRSTMRPRGIWSKE